MRPAREITAEEENFLVVEGPVFKTIRRDPIKPEPEGTIVLKAFRVVGYRPDCDGSLMAEIANIDKDGREIGWTGKSVGLHHESTIVVSNEEWKRMFGGTP